MALFGCGDQNVGIEKDLHLRFHNGSNPFFADILNDSFPVRTRLSHTLVDPQSVDSDHRWTLLDRPDQNTIQLLYNLQLRFGLEAETFA